MNSLSVKTLLLGCGILFMASPARAQPAVALGVDKTLDMFNKAKSAAGQAVVIDDLTYDGFAIKFFPKGFMQNRMGEWHHSKIRCSIRVKDPAFGRAVHAGQQWIQDGVRWLFGQPVDPPSDGEYGDTGLLFRRYVAEFKYELHFGWNGRLTLSENGDKVSDDSQFLGWIGLKRDNKNVHRDWDAKIGANAEGDVENVGSRTKMITKANVTVRLSWGGGSDSFLNRAPYLSMERSYDIHGNGRVDDNWYEHDGEREALAKKHGVNWKCTDPIDVGLGLGL